MVHKVHDNKYNGTMVIRFANKTEMVYPYFNVQQWD